MGASNYVHLEECTVKRLSDAAALIAYDGEEHWIPYSQMAPGEQNKLRAGDEDVTVSITSWLASKLGVDDA